MLKCDDYRQLLLVSDAEVLSMSATAYKQFVDSVPASKDLQNSALVSKVGDNIADAVFNYMKNNGLAADTVNYMGVSFGAGHYRKCILYAGRKSGFLRRNFAKNTN